MDAARPPSTASQVLVTNPPYSGDHKERVVEFCVKSGKPWALLLPNYVATKQYYMAAVAKQGGGLGQQPFYIVPQRGLKYQYTHPEGTGHSDSPFDSFWFVGGHALDLDAVRAALSGCTLVRSVDELRQRGHVPVGKRLNPKQRKRKRDRAM